MIFLVISQRAKSNPNYSLKDLTGHGRFDILPRCILAASRKLATRQSDDIYLFLKEGNQGWIRWDNQIKTEDEDEISIAARIQENWQEMFSEGTLMDLINKISPQSIFLLDELGVTMQPDKIEDNSLIVLGAQKDLTPDDLEVLQQFSTNYSSLSLGDESMLASHAIIYIRQLLMLGKSTAD